MNRTSQTLCALACLAIASLLGCGSPRKSNASGAQSNSITIKGSDTMLQLCTAWAEVYRKSRPEINIQLSGGGTGTGIAALTNGSTDICAASRPINDKERDKIKKERKADAKETPVAMDGITIFVHSANPLNELTLAQLEKIFKGEITDWKDLGGAPGKIVCYGRTNSSGTYLYFQEHVLHKGEFAQDVQALPGTAAVINAVSRDQAAMGYGGVGYVKGVKQLAVKATPDSQAFTPTQENVLSGKYPISRKLFLYTVGEPAGEIKTFVDWVLSKEGQAVCGKADYYPLPTADQK